ncbi:MAG: type IV pilus assembly protein PilM [Parcubacteria group bacterium Gr01-1014_70]|nr:MAG: type IV pilus assembly protein PilM [Parcubacteria group bacterium Gr01-1014_70]
MQALSKHRGFFDFFPPPQFLSMLAVGVDLSDESIKFFELPSVSNDGKTGRFGEENIPSGAIIGGLIQNMAVVEKIISGFQKKYNLSFVRVACPEKKSYLLELSFPLQSSQALRAAVESQFEEWVPMKREEVIFDFDVVAVSEKEKLVRVQISAVSKELARSYEMVFKNAGLTPIAFETESQALARAVVPKDESKTALIVDIGKKETTFAIVCNGFARFTSSLDIGGETLTHALSGSLARSFAKAEEVKHAYGVLPSLQNKETAEVILKHLKPIEEKMREYISYEKDGFSSDSKKMPIECIVMCGGGSNIHGLTEYFSGELMVPVALANPWANIVSFDECIPDMTFDESLRYGTAMGLAMPQPNIRYGE